MVNRLKLKQRAIKALRARFAVTFDFHGTVAPYHLAGIDLAHGREQTVLVQVQGTIAVPLHLRYGP